MSVLSFRGRLGVQTSRHNAHFAQSRSNETGAVGSKETGLALCFEDVRYTDHIVLRDTCERQLEFVNTDQDVFNLP